MCEDLDIEIKKLRKFQKKRFSDSVCFVFINVHVDYSAVRLSLVNVIASQENSSNIKDRSKAEKINCFV